MSTTMKDIATSLNISRATVSYVLSGRGEKMKISKKMIKKVYDTAKDMGYTLNVAAQSISSKKSRIVGLLISGDYKVGFILQMVNEFCKTVIKYNYIPSVISYSDKGGYEEAIKKCLEQRMCGIVALEPDENECNYLMDIAKKASIDTVFVHSRPDSISDGVFVYSDDYDGGKMLAEYLLSLGHKKIAYVNSVSGHHNTGLRLAGFLDVLNKAGLTLEDDYLWNVYTEDMVLEEKGVTILDDEKRRPTAIACFSDTAALEILQQAYKRKIKVPEELSVSGFADMHFAKKLPVPLTTVRQNFVSIGSCACKLLLDKLENTDENNTNVTVTFKVPVELIVRETTTVVRK